MIDDLLEDDFQFSEENSKVNLDEFIKNKSIFSNQKLCEIIASNRYLNINEDITILCMEELSFRRANGQDFNFESEIVNLMKDLPELNKSSFDFRILISQLTNDLIKK